MNETKPEIVSDAAEKKEAANIVTAGYTLTTT